MEGEDQLHLEQVKEKPEKRKPEWIRRLVGFPIDEMYSQVESAAQGKSISSFGSEW